MQARRRRRHTAGRSSRTLATSVDAGNNRVGRDGQCSCAVPAPLVQSRHCIVVAASINRGLPSAVSPAVSRDDEHQPCSVLALGAARAIFSKAADGTRAGAGTGVATSGGRLSYLPRSSRRWMLADALPARLSPEVPGDVLHSLQGGCGLPRRARQVPDLPWADPRAAARRSEGDERQADRCHLANRSRRQMPPRSPLRLPQSRRLRAARHALRHHEQRRPEGAGQWWWG